MKEALFEENLYPEDNCPKDGSQPLSDDIPLSFHSISANQGHFGSSTIYIAADRKVVYRHWGAKKRFFGLLPPKAIPATEEYLVIPKEITTKRQLIAYVKKHRHFWIRF